MSFPRSGVADSSIHQNLLDERRTLLSRAREIALQCNALTPIAKLPSEVLITIFSINTHSEAEIDPRQRRHYPEYGLDHGFKTFEISAEIRTLAQVCHYWRELALGAPSLWNLPFDCNTISRTWATELLRRSGEMPLTVLMDFERSYQRSCTANFRLALENHHRLGELDVYCGTPKQIQSFVLKRLRRAPTPMLHTLSLSCSYYTYGEDDGYDMESMHSDSQSDYLQTMAFEDGFNTPIIPDEYVPRVQNLKTAGFIFQVDCPIYENLTQLHISGLHGNNLPSMYDWFSVISKSENLSSLTLVRCFSRKEERPLFHIQLPKLTSLKIGGSFLPCARLLWNISIPPLHSLNIDITAYPLGGPDSNTFLETISTLLRRHLSVSTPRTLHAFLSKGVIRIADVRPRPFDRISPKLRISFGYLASASKSPSAEILSPLRDLLGSELLGDFTDSDLGHYPSVMQQVLVALMIPFATMPGIKYTYETTAFFAMALLRSSNTQGSISADNTTMIRAPIFPLSHQHIHDLIIHNMDWDLVPAYDGYEVFLRWRRDIGERLSTLRFIYEGRVGMNSPLQRPILEGLCDKLVWHERNYRLRDNYSPGTESDDSLDMHHQDGEVGM